MALICRPLDRSSEQYTPIASRMENLSWGLFLLDRPHDNATRATHADVVKARDQNRMDTREKEATQRNKKQRKKKGDRGRGADGDKVIDPSPLNDLSEISFL